VLQVQGISVEVGGRLVVENASFSVMPRDKVGIVGRNGAGKTSLFKVLGGAVEPHGGKILRKGAFGYLPQDPKIPGSREQHSAISHILSGRNIDEELTRIEKLRLTMEESPSTQNIAKFSKAEDEFASKGGYAAEICFKGRICGGKRSAFNCCRFGVKTRSFELANSRAVGWRTQACGTHTYLVCGKRHVVVGRTDKPLGR